jgi:hypothetical protein
MNVATRGALGLLGFCSLVHTAAADGKVKLDDAQLERVTAGTQADANEIVLFDFARSTSSGRTARGEGTLSVVGNAPEYTLFLGDGAQGNLSSLVNINAVNSQITVLLNLNISIDSSVGTLNQLNVQAPATGVAAGVK